MSLDFTKPVGLALGSGAARGWSHLGVLRALEEANLKIAWIAGTSMGALVGGFLAAARTHELEGLALELDWKKTVYYFAEMPRTRAGLVDGYKIRGTLRELLACETFADLKTPFRVVATDLDSGHETIFHDGSVIEAIRASIAIPGLFSPLKYGGRSYVDGGLLNPVPVNVVRAMGAEQVIAVSLQGDGAGVCSPQPRGRTAQQSERQGVDRLLKKLEAIPLPSAAREWLPRVAQEADRLLNKRARARSTTNASDTPHFLDVLSRSIHISEAQLMRLRMKMEPPDLLIVPDVACIANMDFHRAKEAIAAGYLAARRMLKKAREA